MPTPTLAPRRRPPGAHPTGAPAEPPARVPRRHPLRSNGVWYWAVGVSVALHVLVLLLSPGFIRVGQPPGTTDSDRAESPPGMRMIDPSALPAYEPSTPVVAFEPPAPAAAEARAVRPDPAAPVGATQPSEAQPRPGGAPARSPGAGAAPSAAPLQPGIRDSRLWVTPRRVPDREPTHEELHAEYMARLERRLQGFNDSIFDEADRARRATDWTRTDRQGRRWGVSPDGIHLGDITLPPTTFQPGGGDPDKRARAEEQERTRREIDRQEADAERRRIQQERIRATRERNERERNRNDGS